MGIGTLVALATLMLAISTAAERVVALVKSLIPWLAEEKRDEKGQVKQSLKWQKDSDSLRQFLVLLIAFASAWITAAFVAPGASPGRCCSAGSRCPPT